MIYQRLVWPWLARLDAETAHHLALGALEWAPLRLAPPSRAASEVFGLRFANPLGLAAGFDKNGVAVRSLAALGFGHVEVGTVTPRPQPGRPKPRVFRQKDEQALINRLGFPSDGMEVVARRLERLRERRFVLGVNVGPNADAVGVEGFVQAARRLAPLADYVAVNVSSPNTSGLRDLQLEPIVEAVLPVIGRKPLLVKVSPDLTDEQVRRTCEVLAAHGVAGAIATNTTVQHGGETGGLSGPPLRARATQVVRMLADRLPVVGVGGVASARDAQEKLDAGAALVQLYTGFIYGGPLLPRRIVRGLVA
ncbi:MAG TPA: quinone-dependent dihydroorotate dehydrogenase [Chloroflexota bacterium]|nr:quinone-dependent dihydroorotate dehydrogenase [Chloroflexota bacterium]